MCEQQRAASFIQAVADMIETRSSIANNWVFTVSRWLGANPFNSIGDSPKSWLFYFVFVSIGFSLAGLGVRVIEFAIRYDDSKTDGFTYQLKTVIATVTQFPLVAPGLVHIWQCATKKAEFRYIFSNLPNGQSHDKAGLLVYFILNLAHYLTVYSMSQDAHWLVRKIFLVSGFLTGGNLLNMMIILQFSSLLTALNSNLKSLPKDVSQETVQNTFSQYLKLASAINSLYQRQILFTVVQVFSYTVQYFYIIIDGILYREYMICCQVLLEYASIAVVMRAVIMYLVTARVRDFSSRLDAFYNEQFKLMRQNKELCYDVRRPSYLCIHWNGLFLDSLYLLMMVRPSVKFGACGFFEIGYPLVTSIIAAVATYLVILIQFSIPEGK